MEVCVVIPCLLLAMACVACEGKAVVPIITSLEETKEKDNVLTKTDAIWSNCGNDKDMSIIKNVTITPNPPTKEKPVTIEAYFVLKENITGGSFTANVKYGILPHIKQTIQLCTLANMAGLKCPISKTTSHIVVTQAIPSILPSGHYSGQVIGVDQNGKRLGCINIDVHI